MKQTIAFIGLGVMGQLMAANLEAAGFTVQSFDLNRKGNRKSVSAAAAGADALITMLPDGDAVREAVLEALPSLKPGAAELARGLKLNALFLKETLKHWRAAQKKLPREADHTEIYKYQKKLTRG